MPMPYGKCKENSDEQAVGEEAGSRASEGTHMADANYWPSGASRVQLGEFTFTEE